MKLFKVDTQIRHRREVQYVIIERISLVRALEDVIAGGIELCHLADAVVLEINPWSRWTTLDFRLEHQP
jgi:hypothetical protein